MDLASARICYREGMTAATVSRGLGIMKAETSPHQILGVVDAQVANRF